MRMLVALCIGLLLFVSPNIVNAQEVPVAQSAKWHYERALIYHLSEKDGKATIELYKALEKDPALTEALFFMGFLMKNRGRWADAAEMLERTLANSKTEHTPARLLLARVRAENSEFSAALTALEKVAEAIKLDETFEAKIKQYRTTPLSRRASEEVREKELSDFKSKVLTLVDEAERVLLDTPEGYRAATLAKGVQDSLIYNELAALFAEEEKEENTLKVLTESLDARNGFSPSALLQMGQIYQKNSHISEAVAVLERAVDQLTALGFSESAGDFSTADLQKMRAQLKATKKAPADSITGKGKSK